MGFVAGPETSAFFNQNWYGGNILSSAIGQQNHQFTPMQLANFTAVIANGGTLYSAHMLKRVQHFDHSYELYSATPEVRNRVEIGEREMASIQEGMRMAVQSGGTAFSVFRNFPIDVAGKTGSVQVGNRPNNGVFVAYAPYYTTPEIAISLIVQNGGAGSVVAPIARDIIGAYFRLQEEMTYVSEEGTLVI